MDWYIGDRAKITATFTDALGSLGGPAALTIKLQTPAGVETSLVWGTDPEPVRDSLGVFSFHITFTASGNWFYRAEATGARVVARDGTIHVNPSPFYP